MRRPYNALGVSGGAETSRAPSAACRVEPRIVSRLRATRILYSLDSATPTSKRKFPSLSRVIENNGSRVKYVRIESTPCPPEHSLALGMAAVANRQQEFRVSVRTTDVFRWASAGACNTPRVGAVIRRHEL